MPNSMTGFGVATAENDAAIVTVEIRSVNSRYLDLQLRSSRHVAMHENEVREIIGKHLKRGRVTVFVNEELKEGASTGSLIDKTKARAYILQLEELRHDMNMQGELQIGSLVGISELFRTEDDPDQKEYIWQLVKKALEESLGQMAETRKAEGETLARDILHRNEEIATMLSQIKGHADNQPKAYAERLKQRVADIVGDTRLDQSRLETEIALAAEKLDITEEIVRLDSHLGMFKDTLSSDEPIGKALNFITQEMGREANTIASKAWAAEISQGAIKIKELIEQIREQVQNLE